MTMEPVVHDASDYAYTAGRMARHLDRIILRRQTLPDELALGVYDEATRFFREALNGLEGQAICHSLQGPSPYELARQTCLVGAVPIEGPALRDLLRAYATLLDRLTLAQPLTQDDRETAGRLRDFFRALEAAGNHINAARFAAGSDFTLR